METLAKQMVKIKMNTDDNEPVEEETEDTKIIISPKNGEASH